MRPAARACLRPEVTQPGIVFPVGDPLRGERPPASLGPAAGRKILKYFIIFRPLFSGPPGPPPPGAKMKPAPSIQPSLGVRRQPFPATEKGFPWSFRQAAALPGVFHPRHKYHSVIHRCVFVSSSSLAVRNSPHPRLPTTTRYLSTCVECGCKHLPWQLFFLEPSENFSPLSQFG